MEASVGKRKGRIVHNKFRSFDLRSNYSLVASARKGIKPDVFYELASVAGMPEKVLATIIHVSPRTISNYKADKKTLDPVQSEHLLKLVTMYELGEEIFGTVEEFNYWLRKPFWNSNECPLDWLVTPGGVELVMDEIARIAYGDAV